MSKIHTPAEIKTANDSCEAIIGFCHYLASKGAIAEGADLEELAVAYGLAKGWIDPDA